MTNAILMTMRRCIALFTLCLSSFVLAQPENLAKLWTAVGSQPITVQRYGGGTITGFSFEVIQGAAGELPLLQHSNVVNGARLFRKIDATRYALYCQIFHDLNKPGETSGVLLRPGQYVVEQLVFVEPKHLWEGAQMLAGIWLSGEAVTNHFRLTPGSTYTQISLELEQVSGFAFSIAQRADGALPVINFVCSNFNNSSRLNHIYRRTGDGKWRIYAIWDSMGASNPGLRLIPGEYVFQVPASLPNPSQYRYSAMFTGYWLVP